MSRARRRLPLLLSTFLVLACVPSAAAAGNTSKAASPYAGLGAWIDMYDSNAFDRPEVAVADIKGHGVKTIYLQTGNHSTADYRSTGSGRQSKSIFRADRAERFIHASHKAGLKIVAWYLPSFRNPTFERQRSLDILKFATNRGQQFDSFALDIESPAVKPPRLRTKRLLRMVADLRSATGKSYPLGAIIPSPMGMNRAPNYWPAFPYKALAKKFDVLLPMNYFTPHKATALEPWFTTITTSKHDFTAGNVDIIRSKTGDQSIPIHILGGVSKDADRSSVEGFVKGVNSAQVLGASLYGYRGTAPEHWTALRGLLDR